MLSKYVKKIKKTNSNIIRHQAKEMSEQALRKILEDCITSKEYMGHQGQTLYLDVYVISPKELEIMIMEAREQGRRDTMKYIY